MQALLSVQLEHCSRNIANPVVVPPWQSVCRITDGLAPLPCQVACTNGLWCNNDCTRWICSAKFPTVTGPSCSCYSRCFVRDLTDCTCHKFLNSQSSTFSRSIHLYTARGAVSWTATAMSSSTCPGVRTYGLMLHFLFPWGAPPGKAPTYSTRPNAGKVSLMQGGILVIYVTRRL